MICLSSPTLYLSWRCCLFSLWRKYWWFRRFSCTSRFCQFGRRLRTRYPKLFTHRYLVESGFQTVASYQTHRVSRSILPYKSWIKFRQRHRWIGFHLGWSKLCQLRRPVYEASSCYRGRYWNTFGFAGICRYRWSRTEGPSKFSRRWSNLRA